MIRRNQASMGAVVARKSPAPVATGTSSEPTASTRESRRGQGVLPDQVRQGAAERAAGDLADAARHRPEAQGRRIEGLQRVERGDPEPPVGGLEQLALGGAARQQEEVAGDGFVRRHPLRRWAGGRARGRAGRRSPG